MSLTPEEKDCLKAEIRILIGLHKFGTDTFPKMLPPHVSYGFTNDLQKVITGLSDLLLEPLEGKLTIETITPETIRRVWKAKGIRSAPIRQCGICEVWLHYEFDGAVLVRNTSCGCNSLDGRQEADFNDVLKHITMQSNYQHRLELARQYFLDIVDDGDDPIVIDPPKPIVTGKPTGSADDDDEPITLEPST